MPDHVAAFVSFGLWSGLSRVDECQAVGFANGQGLVAGVLFHNYEPDAGVIELTAYASRRDWLTKERLRAVFAYPFDQLRCRIAVARIAETNRRARRVWRALGAKEYRIPELRAAGVAECVQTLAADDWRKSKFMR